MAKGCGLITDDCWVNIGEDKRNMLLGCTCGCFAAAFFYESTRANFKFSILLGKLFLSVTKQFKGLTPPIACFVYIGWTLKRNYSQLTKAMDALTHSSVDAILKSIRALAFHPVTQFNRLEAMEQVEALKNEAHDTHIEKEAHYNLAHKPCWKLELLNQDFLHWEMRITKKHTADWCQSGEG